MVAASPNVSNFLQSKAQTKKGKEKITTIVMMENTEDI
jgi:hypothetical protein